MLTGPATIYDWSLDGFYGDKRRAVREIAWSLRSEIKMLIARGAKIIQIDEPSLAQTHRDFDILAEAFGIMFSGLAEKAYFIMHTCYGAKVFEKMYPQMLELPVDNLDLETANSNMVFLRTIAHYLPQKDITIGVVDVHTHEIEDEMSVEKRIRDALFAIPKENLWIGPDCGLKTRTVEEAKKKLQVIADTTIQIRSLFS